MTLLKKRPWIHWQDYLDVAVVVASMTAVTRVHQDSIKAIHDGVTWALGHVGADVQKLWVTNILFQNKRNQVRITINEKKKDVIQNNHYKNQTFVIFPPLKLANLFSESVRTLEVRWTVNRLVAGTFFLHLKNNHSYYLQMKRLES